MTGSGVTYLQPICSNSKSIDGEKVHLELPDNFTAHRTAILNERVPIGVAIFLSELRGEEICLGGLSVPLVLPVEQICITGRKDGEVDLVERHGLAVLVCETLGRFTSLQEDRSRARGSSSRQFERSIPLHPLRESRDDGMEFLKGRLPG